MPCANIHYLYCTSILRVYTLKPCSEWLVIDEHYRQVAAIRRELAATIETFTRHAVRCQQRQKLSRKMATSAGLDRPG